MFGLPISERNLLRTTLQHQTDAANQQTTIHLNCAQAKSNQPSFGVYLSLRIIWLACLPCPGGWHACQWHCTAIAAQFGYCPSSRTSVKHQVAAATSRPALATTQLQTQLTSRFIVFLFRHSWLDIGNFHFCHHGHQLLALPCAIAQWHC